MGSAAEITCTRETGKYDPPYLARCAVTTPFTSGTGSQKMTIGTGVSVRLLVSSDFIKIEFSFWSYDSTNHSSNINSILSTIHFTSLWSKVGFWSDLTIQNQTWVMGVHLTLHVFQVYDALVKIFQCHCTKYQSKVLIPDLSKVRVTYGLFWLILYFQGAPCSDDATGEWSIASMKLKLNSQTDTVCGFRHKVVCLVAGSKSFRLFWHN